MKSKVLALYVSVSLAIIGGLWSTPSRANILVNGDFQTGDFTGWTLFATTNGSVGLSGANVSLYNVTGSGASDAAQFQVGQLSSVYLQPAGGGIYQNVTTGSGIGTFSADIADQNGGNADGGTFEALLDGVVQSTFATGSTSGSSSLAFSAAVSAGTHQIEILVTRKYTTGASTPTQYVDNVSFDSVDAPVSATPLPAALPLFASGLGAFGLLGWRRKRKPQAAA